MRPLALALLLAGCSVDEQEAPPDLPPGALDPCPGRAVCDQRGVCRCEGWAVPAPDGAPPGPA